MALPHTRAVGTPVGLSCCSHPSSTDTPPEALNRPLPHHKHEAHCRSHLHTNWVSWWLAGVKLAVNWP